MIGRIAGRLEFRGPDHVLIDVGGVGYIVHVSERTLAQLPATGARVALFTELVVREDLMQLFGFPTMQEKEWHRLLTTVQGVGAKASMAILGTLGAEGVSRAIALGDWSAVRAAPGVGPKLAQRVVNELKEKAPAVMAMGSGPALAAPVPAPPEPAKAPDGAPEGGPESTPENATAITPASVAAGTGAGAHATAEALSALVNLGYAHGEAAAAVARASGEEREAGTAALIRAALRLLAPKP